MEIFRKLLRKANGNIQKDPFYKRMEIYRKILLKAEGNIQKDPSENGWKYSERSESFDD